MNPIEAGIGALLDLDRDFVGGEALRAVRDDGPARRTVGLVCDGEPFPPMEPHWPVTTADGGAARGRPLGGLLVRARAEHRGVPGRRSGSTRRAGSLVQAPDGPRRGEPHPIPFV